MLNLDDMNKLAARYVRAVTESDERAEPLRAALFAQACVALVALTGAFVAPDNVGSDEAVPKPVHNPPAEPERNSIIYRATNGQLDGGLPDD